MTESKTTKKDIEDAKELVKKYGVTLGGKFAIELCDMALGYLERSQHQGEMPYD